ncbi:MAG: N-acetyl sugar amidotransferase [Acidimicrobiia bacterium]
MIGKTPGPSDVTVAADREAPGGDPQLCTRCFYDSTIPGITFHEGGVCSYCALHDEMDRQYPTGPAGAKILERVVEEVREAGRGKQYDCVVGVSGGCDSSYLVVKLVELGLRPLAVHFDNTWNSPVATSNIYNVLEKVGVDLHTLVVDNREYDDIYRSFMLAGTRDVEAPTDLGLMTTLYRAAEQYGISYAMEGHSFRTEGVAPLSFIYFDGRYIRSVHRQFGTVPMKTFPNMPLGDFLKWAGVKNIRRIRPLYYLDYHKEEAKELLSREYGWEWYGGHHLENRFTAFYHSYFLPRRFGVDGRKLGYSGLVRSGQMTREEGLRLLAEPIECDPGILALVKKRLRFSDDEFEAVMNLPRKSYRDYPTYKQTFERLKPLFWLLYKLDRVPKSFYVKFAGGR